MLKFSLSQSVERLSEDTFAAQVSDYMLKNSMEFPSSGRPQVILVESVKSLKGCLDDLKQKEHLRKSLISC